MSAPRVKLLCCPDLLVRRVDGLRLPPLAIATLAAYLRQHDVEVDIDDLDIRSSRDPVLQYLLLDGREPAGPLDEGLSRIISYYDEDQVREVLGRSNTLVRLSNPVYASCLLKGETSDPELDAIVHRLLSHVDCEGYDLVGFSFQTYFNPVLSFVVTAALARRIREETGARTVIGGRGLTFLPRRLFADLFAAIDYMVIGPGEEPLRRLWEVQSGIEVEANVPGLAWQEGGEIRSNPPWRMSDGLGPAPTFDPLPLNLYHYLLDEIAQELPSAPKLAVQNGWGVTLFPFLFVKGCINNCAFCVLSTTNCRALRPAHAVDALETMVRDFGARHFLFLNSEINLSPCYVERFCDEILTRRLNIQWSDSARLDGLNAALLNKMRRAGCVRLWFGIELASQRMLNYVGKNLTVAQAEQGLRLAHEAGIWNGVNLIIGMPYEQREDVDATIAFLHRNAPHYDMWELNKFHLRGGGFHRHPKTYRIRIGPRRPNLPYWEYDELEGLAWPERNARMETEYRRVRGHLDPQANEVTSNAHLLFSLYDRLGDKRRVQAWLGETFSASTQSGNYWTPPESGDPSQGGD